MKNSVKNKTERDQATVRLINCCIILIYTITCHIYGLIDKSIVLMYLFSVPFSLFILFWAIKKSEENHPRQILGMIADLGTTTVAMSLSGMAASPLFLFYLWITFGNGFRYGKTYLFISMFMSIFGFSAVVYFSPFWSNQPFLSVGLLMSLIVLPMYVASLLKKLQSAIELAENANKAKSQFLASMSHEIRTPLNGVVGMSNMLSSTRMTRDQKKFVTTIQSSAHTLLALIENILDISKIEAGKIQQNIIDFDLHELINSVVDILFPHAKSEGILCKLHIAADVPFRLHGNALHIRQILINLIGNATKFTEKGSIEVNIVNKSSDKDHASLRFEVIDTGIGISEEEQKLIFETFTQADQSINRKYGGSGLGTTISKKLVNLMGGSIGVNSILNKGSTFWFELDLKNQSESIEVNKKPIFSPSPNVLLIGTIGARHSLLIQHLHDWNIDWDHAGNIEEALVSLKNANGNGDLYDVALVDYQNLNESIDTFAQNIYSASIKTNLILISDKDFSQNRHRALLSSGYFCILKSPIEKRLLFNALHATSTDLTKNAKITRLVNFASEIKTQIPLNIIIGEDNLTNQKVIRTILEYAGHKPDIVSNGIEVLDAIEKKTYDMVILDMHMPEMNGIETAKTLRFMSSSNFQLPIIMLTADATTDAVKSCEDAGIDIFLTKPIESEKLLRTVQSLSPKKQTDKEFQSTRSTQIIDQECLNKLATMNKSSVFMSNLISEFITDTRIIISKIENDINDNDFSKIEDHSHAIKGSARSIGAVSLAQVASQIQDEIQSGLLINLPSLSSELGHEFEITESLLNKYLDKIESAVL